MEIIYPDLIAKALQLLLPQVRNTIGLLESGATIPFISRYRKEMTGGLNEVQITDVKNWLDKLTELKARKDTILNALEKQEKLTPELKARIESSWDSNEIEDIYLPYKPKRVTRAAMARKKGLEPLAKLIAAQKEPFLSGRVPAFVQGEVKDEEDALSGARDIIAEWVNENERTRNQVRFAFRQAVISAKVIKGKEEEGAKYRNYFQFEEKLSRCQSHRLLAVRRGEEEGFLRVSIAPADDDACLESLYRQYKRNNGACWEQFQLAIDDAYKRLLKPSIESEFAKSSKLKADEEAIRVFADNLRQLLLAPPLGQKRVLGIDPGYRTGCKVVCLDAQGNLLHNETIYPHPPKNERKKAEIKIQHLVEAYNIDAISIGNGTASRETEEFITNIRYTKPVKVFVVSEDGASVYSASAVARAEFPEYDVTVRGAVSIGRRLMDPLAELVKIDPKSIGVGQYQHAVDQALLKKSLDQTVESCVNLVGVNVNTASKELLTYISGLGPVLAQNIVQYRAENGPFVCRKDLKKVPRLGEKAFEQCAGFLRIPNGTNPLDNSAVHPESYPVVEKMAADLHCTVGELMKRKELKQQIRLEQYQTDQIGMPTLQDIMKELDKPGRDPRSEIQEFSFNPDIHTIDDLQEGMILPGIVTNITNFGCFVDVGIKENGLVHISELADRFVSNPADVVSIHQHVQVRVLSIDTTRKRVQLSMKGIES
ncbi:RNA-binding transcriptional accessory protein [Parabacteroides sp. AGMB00274]|uniref:RNA-binding transcriptional accessory protein n=1 Tax=Parabacteroides faecalis TaxID=2924040 RepID=A0ABT0C649_9BACT|nr:Tex family protein [Parabacteroides faecalis]MCI7286886.1 RNA-binding transcriptional accessory protein [Parabacteroides sp.]MCJ2382420.1 RNA-binding transcriptional accessory protein [Parabacteroides faecalis]MDY6256163.1 Tex family protein [Bacteroidales bacterium]